MKKSRELFERLKKIKPVAYKLTLLIYNLYLSFKDFSEIKYFKRALSIHRKIKSSLSKSVLAGKGTVAPAQQTPG